MRCCATSTSMSGWNLEINLSHPTFSTMASLKLPLNDVLSAINKLLIRGSLRTSELSR